MTLEEDCEASHTVSSCSMGSLGEGPGQVLARTAEMPRSDSRSVAGASCGAHWWQESETDSTRDAVLAPCPKVWSTLCRGVDLKSGSGPGFSTTSCMMWASGCGLSSKKSISLTRVLLFLVSNGQILHGACSNNILLFVQATSSGCHSRLSGVLPNGSCLSVRKQLSG